MNAKDAAAMFDALKTIYAICSKEQRKKTWYNKRCYSCPARWPGLMCNYNDVAAKAPPQWSAEYFKEDGE